MIWGMTSSPTTVADEDENCCRNTLSKQTRLHNRSFLGGPTLMSLRCCVAVVSEVSPRTTVVFLLASACTNCVKLDQLGTNLDQDEESPGGGGRRIDTTNVLQNTNNALRTTRHVKSRVNGLQERVDPQDT